LTNEGVKTRNKKGIEAILDLRLTQDHLKKYLTSRTNHICLDYEAGNSRRYDTLYSHDHEVGYRFSRIINRVTQAGLLLNIVIPEEVRNCRTVIELKQIQEKREIMMPLVVFKTVSICFSISLLLSFFLLLTKKCSLVILKNISKLDPDLKLKLIIKTLIMLCKTVRPYQLKQKHKQ